MISLNWVKDYIDIEDEDLVELAGKVTRAGINVEGVHSQHIDNLVIGEVKECIDHPDSDHLHICQVDVGDKVIQIVCGAPNVRVGLKVVVALPGCVLPGNFKIETGKIRGVESNGMLCALFELGLEEKTEETHAKGIDEVPDKYKAGEDANIYLGTDDTTYELDIHKHRNNDCYYHIGFAYEIACILNKKVKLPNIKHKEIADKVDNHISLTVETDNCPYYTCKMAKGVVIKESPEFIKKRLISAGMRPINNVVDISNYVMLEFGQPLHFFDKDKLGDKIVVRQAKENEDIKTLDGQDRVLSSNDIVITDGVKPVCIAGVMGGENTDVDDNTKDILIESAIFNAINIRNTSKRLDLKSEASIRYGKGLSFEYTDMAIERACTLLEEYADAEILSGTVKHDKIDKEHKFVEFTSKEVSTVLGLDLSNQDVEIELDRLDFEYKLTKDKFKVTIPYRRLDIDPNVNDIAEEIGRLYGYQNLVSTLPRIPDRRGIYVGDVKIRKEASRRLRTLGLTEAKTYTLTSPKMADSFKYQDKKLVVLPRPMSVDKSVVRGTLIPSLLTVYDYNKARHVSDINIYEVAKTYDTDLNEDIKACILMKGNYISNDWAHISVKVDFYLIKGMIENLLDYLGFKNRYSFVVEEIPDMHPGMSAKILVDREEIGIIGRVHPNTKKDEIYVAEISLSSLYEKSIKSIKYKEASKYPEIVKDVAFVVNKDVTSLTLQQQIKKSGGRMLSDISVFDVYEGENILNSEKSIAYKLTFSDNTRTLEEEEVMNVFNTIIDEVCSKCGAKVRNK